MSVLAASMSLFVGLLDPLTQFSIFVGIYGRSDLGQGSGTNPGGSTRPSLSLILFIRNAKYPISASDAFSISYDTYLRFAVSAPINTTVTLVPSKPLLISLLTAYRLSPWLFPKGLIVKSSSRNTFDRAAVTNNIDAPEITLVMKAEKHFTSHDGPTDDLCALHVIPRWLGECIPCTYAGLSHRDGQRSFEGWDSI